MKGHKFCFQSFEQKHKTLVDPLLRTLILYWLISSRKVEFTLSSLHANLANLSEAWSGVKRMRMFKSFCSVACWWFIEGPCLAVKKYSCLISLWYLLVIKQPSTSWRNCKELINGEREGCGWVAPWPYYITMLWCVQGTGYSVFLLVLSCPTVYTLQTVSRNSQCAHLRPYNL